MKANLEEILNQNRIMIIDGAMSTALERLGADNSSSLWTAGTLASNPELVKQVHLDYFRAGADCGITCSYQATIPGLTAHGYSNEEAEQIIADSVRVFIEARDEWWENEGRESGRPYPLCLAGVGPYGAYLADGSEYTGHYGVSDEVLRNFHRRRLEILKEAGADIMLIETQPSFREAEIAAEICEELGVDYWISFSCRDGFRINEGDMIRDCVRALSEGHPHLKMVGVNCSKPEHISSLIREMKSDTDLPIAVYPNSGLVYDPVTKTWTEPEGMVNFGEYALDYMKAGAAAVGGCCTTDTEHVRQIAEARDKYLAFADNMINYRGIK